MSLSSSSPSRSFLRNFWRVADSSSPAGLPVAGPHPRRRGSRLRAAGSSTSSTRSSAESSARLRTFFIAASRVSLDRDLDQVADDGIDVAADVADLGELASPRP